jgi:predicted 3-demethylubiquinone-9 3-methyltransferase (glyoxalase superfamily)
VQKITPCLWFDNQAEEAANFYVSIFENSKILRVVHYPDDLAGKLGKPIGSVMTVKFKLDGQEYLGLNGGPNHKFTPAISLIVNCKNQEEIDRMWSKLLEGGSEVQCGWLTDKFGMSWQVVPDILPEIFEKCDADGLARVMNEVCDMIKLDVSRLEKAASKPVSV